MATNDTGSLVITSDPQYPWTNITDQPTLGSETQREKERRSEELIRSQYNSINEYNNSVNKSTILIYGDMTAFGHPEERNKINELLRILNRTYYYGLGNHDIENNNNDCLNNRCAYGSMFDFNQHVQNHIVNNRIMGYDSQRIGLYNSNTMGSFSYSMYIDHL